MTRLDRYILRQLIVGFGFFVLVFTGVVWLTQAVRLIDTVVASGQSAQVFLQFSALVLPQVLVIVLPLAGIGAALSALNRLQSESELTVMMAAGNGPPALLRPVAVFGVMIAVLLAIVLQVLVPVSGRMLAERTRSIRSDLANALVVDRQFLHPLSGLTLFISGVGQAGEMEGIFLNDQRDPNRVVTYSAERALLVRDEAEARLVMSDGVALTSAVGGGQLNSVRFDQFVFDLSDVLSEDGERVPRPSEYGVRDLLSPTPEMLAHERYGLGDYLSEGHYKLALPLLALFYPVIALVTLLAGGYRRSGFGRRVIVAIGVCVILHVLMFAARSQLETRPELWPLVYAPHLLALAYAGALLAYLTRGGAEAREATP